MHIEYKTISRSFSFAKNTSKRCSKVLHCVLTIDNFFLLQKYFFGNETILTQTLNPRVGVINKWQVPFHFL